MKPTYLFILIYLWQNIAIINAQLDFKVDELILSQIVVPIDRDVIDEDLESGPFAWFKCCIYNKTDSPIVIYPSTSVCYIEYNYQDRKYKFGSIPMPFTDLDSRILASNQIAELYFGIYLFTGTPIYKTNNGDYTYEVIKVLPTLKIRYVDKLYNILSSDVKRVIVKHFSGSYENVTK